MSRKIKFTKDRLLAIEPPPASVNRVTYFDIGSPGLALRVSYSGVKTFIVRKKVKGCAIRATLGRFPAMTIEQARRLAAARVALMLDGVDPNKAKRAERARTVTLGECLEDYLTLRGRNLVESTRQSYWAFVRNHLADWENKPLSHISRDMISRRHQRILTGEGTGKPGRPVAANNVMRMIRALFNFADGQYEGEDGRSLFPDNPVKRLSHTRSWAPERRRQKIIKLTDLPRWFDALDVLRQSEADGATTVADYLEFILFTGLRRDDALSLRWDQVNLIDNTMCPVIHKKSRIEMSFPLTDHVAGLLTRRHAKRVNIYVFPGREPFGPDGLSKRFDEPKRQIARVVEMTGIQFSSHDIRRTFITVAESLDLSVFALKRLCSHSLGGDVTAGYVIMDVARLQGPANQITTHLLRAAGRLPSAKVISLPRIGKPL